MTRPKTKRKRCAECGQLVAHATRAPTPGKKMTRPKAKRKRCAECGRLRGRLHIEWHPGTLEWQCSDDTEKCSTLFQQRWARGHRG